MKKYVRGELTVVLAMCLFCFLSFCLVLLEGICSYNVQMRARRAADLTAFSILSEYQSELLKQYGLFFLDLDYEQGRESMEMLSGLAENYLRENAEGFVTKDLSFHNFIRATDGNGQAFFEQAVNVQKERMGIGILEQEVADYLDILKEEEEVDIEKETAETYEKAQEKIQEVINDLREELPESELPEITLPEISFPSSEMLLERVAGDDAEISEKSIDLAGTVGKRQNAKGSGTEKERRILDWQMFYGYLMKHCSFYGKKDENISIEALEYQLEYIISGKSSDRENLMNVVWKIFLIRAVSNYIRYHQDPLKKSEAAEKAAVCAAAFGNAELTLLVRELFLLSDAVEEGIEETAEIFHGKKVPVYNQGVLCELTMGYEEYLYMFLNLISQEDRIGRSMDVVEGEIRKLSGYEAFRLDHCTDCFSMEWTYRFDGIFSGTFGIVKNRYQRQVSKEICYEK